MTIIKPIVGESFDSWGITNNAALDTLDTGKQNIASLSTDVAAHVTDGTALDVALKAKIVADGRGLGIFRVTEYGVFTAGSTAAVNTATAQAANDACYAAGGGFVLLPQGGEYNLKGLILDSRVRLVGSQTTLRHPDGNGTDMVRSRTVGVLGSMSAGSATLTLSSTPALVEVGTIVGVRGAGGILDTQYTSLVAAITISQTASIQITSASGFPAAGYLMVGTEILSYTGISAGVLSGVTRGEYGTAAAPASLGAKIGMPRNLVAEVTAISGTTITLDRPAVQAAANTTTTFGSVYVSCSGINVNGNKIATGGAASWYPFLFEAARWSEIRNVTVSNAEAAFALMKGSTDCTVQQVLAVDCGVPDSAKGAAMWLFQSCRRNKLTNLTINGRTWVGLYLDDRTSVANEWDGPNEDNLVDQLAVDVPRETLNIGINIVGSNRNKITNWSVKGCRTGVVLDTNQSYSHDAYVPNCRDNILTLGTIQEVNTPYILTSPGNSFSRVRWDYAATGGSNVSTNAGGNWMDDVARTGASPSSLFANGAQSAPALAFASETNTGFYRPAASMIQVVIGSALIARFQTSGLRLENGMNLDIQGTTGCKIGVGASQKIGFWGATPVIQPSGTPAAATDLATALALVNDLRTKLLALGIVA